MTAEAKKAAGEKEPKARARLWDSVVRSGGASVLLVLIVLCFLVGLAVIAFDPDYRVGKILETNKDFYPAVEVEGAPAPAADEGGGEGEG